ncbi:MAG TPA: GWxTD domain-containing protein [Acidobacteriota bacterium]|nr:GWxTD domain-containing protein [Acidobacteriota bacterium]
MAQYYKNWLEEDVVYIITDEERQFFRQLSNDEEREAFIEQFWHRRNPNPRSPFNIFKEEHYRRIAYANQHFASGIAGWRTDRGRIYIIWGEPDQKTTHMGGFYERPFREGGGTTAVYPFETWWYRHLEGVGDDIEIEFVDRTGSNEFRLAMDREEKDALINVPNAGLLLAEEMGLSNKEDRAFFNPGVARDPLNPQFAYSRIQDNPFARMERYFGVQRPPSIKFDDLKTIVTSRISYNLLEFDVRADYMKLSSERALVPITIKIDNSQLEFKKENGFNSAKVNVYGIVTNLTGRIIAEWEEEIRRDFLDIFFHEGKDRPSVYQRMVALPIGQRYKLDLVLKDVNSGNVGSTSVGLAVPKFTDTALQSSTIILANTITNAPVNADALDQYIIGEMRVVPNVTSEYIPGQNLVPYLHIYNPGIDQVTQRPLMDVTFKIRDKNKKLLEEATGTELNSEQFFYGPRVVIVGKIQVPALSPGGYTLEIHVLDRIANNTIVTSTEFTVRNPDSMAAAISR